MKRIFLLASISWLSCLPVRAQQNALKVPYSRQIPDSVRQHVPAGGSSRFFGSPKQSISGSKIFFHLYSTPMVTRGIDQSNLQLHMVDVFEESDRRNNRKLKQINAIYFNYSGQFKVVDAEVIWVEPKRKRIPILKLYLFNPTGFTGPYGTVILISFANGLNAQPVVQEFHRYTTPIEGEGVEFDQQDERGYTLATHIYVHSADGANRIKTHWQWDGNKFTPPDKKR